MILALEHPWFPSHNPCEAFLERRGAKLLRLDYRIPQVPRGVEPDAHCTEKLSCREAVELLPTQTSKSEGSTTQPFLAALQ